MSRSSEVVDGVPAPPARPSLRSTGRARLADPTFRWLVTGAGISVLVVLGLMVLSTTSAAWPVFRKMGLEFFTSDLWDPGRSRSEVTGHYGALPFVYGTLVTSAIAILIAVPVSIGVALYIVELAPRWVRKPVSYTVETLAAIPSIVFGLWGVLYFAPNYLVPAMRWLERNLGQRGVWLFEGPVFGRGYFVAGVVLAIMILPIITAISREVFLQVPDDERHAAYALGATRWEAMRRVVLPRSRPGMIGAVMLGLGRALGETIAIAMLVGSSQRMGRSLFFGGDAMAAVIVNTFADAAPEAIWALIAVGVTLFLITIVVNILARLLVWRIGDLTGDAAV